MSAATTPPSPSPVKPGDFLIAVDGGFAHCLAAGLEPDLFVGDLDSLSPELVSLIGCERIELPCEKDDTDTVYACKEGLARGYESFVLHCALGGDVGHELANIQTLAFLRERGARGTLLGGSQQVHLVTPDASPASFAAPPARAYPSSPSEMPPTASSNAVCNGSSRMRPSRTRCPWA